MYTSICATSIISEYEIIIHVSKLYHRYRVGFKGLHVHVLSDTFTVNQAFFPHTSIFLYVCENIKVMKCNHVILTCSCKSGRCKLSCGFFF